MSEAKQTIYVVDDDEAMRDSMTWLLEGEGYTVVCYVSAGSFLAARNDEKSFYSRSLMCVSWLWECGEHRL